MESLAAALKNNKQQEETNKLLKAILKGQEEDKKNRKSAAAALNRKNKLNQADKESSQTFANGLKDSLKKDSDKKNGIFGGIFKMLKGPLFIGGMALALGAVFKNDKFRNGFFQVLKGAWKVLTDELYPSIKKFIEDGLNNIILPWWENTAKPKLLETAEKLGNTIGNALHNTFLIPLSKWASENFGWLGIKPLGERNKYTNATDRAAQTLDNPNSTEGEKDKARRITEAAEKREKSRGMIYEMQSQIDFRTEMMERHKESYERDKANKKAERFDPFDPLGTFRNHRIKKYEDWLKEIEDRKKWIKTHQERIKEYENIIVPPEKSRGGWITGPQSGYPVSLTGQGIDFIGHGTEYVAMKSNGGFVIPFDTPHTRMDPSLTGRRMGEAMRMGFSAGGRIVEHLHGDPTRAGYEPAGHGSPTNAHDHFAFDSKATRDLVIAGLRSKGYQIGSTDRPGDHGWHGASRAVDIPWSQFGSGAIGESDYKQSRQLLADVKSILGDTSTTSTTSSTGDISGMDMMKSGIASMGKGLNEILDTPIYQLIEDSISGISNMFSGMFGSIGNFFGSSSSSSMPSGPVEPLSGSVLEKAKKMYEYAKTKGLSSAQAKGLIANIQRESTFNATARSGDDGGPGGLFQWKGSRQTPEVASLVNAGDWKGQIDYALKEDVGPQYKGATAGMNAFDASMWWAEKWERPASLQNARNKHSQFLNQYNFSRGGMLNGVRTPMAGPDPNELLRELNQKASQGMAGGSQPIIIPMQGGGGGGGQMSDEGTVPTMPAGIPNNPGNNFQLSLVMTRNLLSANIGG